MNRGSDRHRDVPDSRYSPGAVHAGMPCLRRRDGRRPALLPELRRPARRAARASRRARPPRPRPRPSPPGSRVRPGVPPGRRLAAGRGDRHRAPRRDAAARRVDRPGRRGRSGAGAGRDRRRIPRDARTGRGGWRASGRRVRTGSRFSVSTVPKDGATAQTVDEAKQQAISDGAIEPPCSTPTSTPSLPPGNYVVYSGVHTERRSAEVALKGLRENFPSAAVVEVASDGGSSEDAASDGGVDRAPGGDDRADRGAARRGGGARRGEAGGARRRRRERDSAERRRHPGGVELSPGRSNG